METIEGFNLLLEPYCAHCPQFEVDVKKIEEPSWCFNSQTNSFTVDRPFTGYNINCENAQKCKNIYRYLKLKISKDTNE